MSVAFHIVMPARLNSSRLPKKVLADIGGKPMLQHTYECALATSAKSIIIATEDEEVAKVARGFGADVCMTGDHHQSGTERIAEALALRQFGENEIIVGLQSDVPFIAAGNIEQVAMELAARPQAKIATLYKNLDDQEDLHNPSMVKLIKNHQDYAIYFSRLPIPFAKEAHDSYLLHIGLYSYRAGYLRQYTSYQPTALEKIESLEQLRALYYGDPIYVALAKEESPISVDTPEDLEKARAIYFASLSS